MASPVAAGVAALGAAAHPDLSASQLRERLRNTAADVGLPSEKQGAGRVDAAAMVDGGDGDDKSVLTVTDPDGEGDGFKRYYELGVTGDLESTDSVNCEDSLEGSTAVGHVDGGTDEYRFSGKLEYFTSKGADLAIDGETVDPGEVVQKHAILIDETEDKDANYEFQVGGDAEKGAYANDSPDSVEGTTISGAANGYHDSYRYTGEISDWTSSGDGSLTVYVDGTEVSPGDSNAAPEASFSVDASYPTVGEVVSFDASASSDEDGSITSYEWAFGDGETTSGKTVEHSFADPGDYEVTLTVTDDAGRSGEAVETVSVVPEADETVTVAPGSDHAFDPSSLTVEPGTRVRFEWDAGGHTLTVRSQPEGADWTGAPEEHDAGYVHTHTFETTGEYEYYCEVHPEDMQGTVTVEDGTDCQSIPEAIAGEDGQVGDAELLQAIRNWREDTEVPGTCGETVDDATLLELIRLWRTGETVSDRGVPSDSV